MQRPDREKERKDAIRRDLVFAGLAVAAFVCLGAFLTFMSGDAARLFQSVGAVLMNRPVAPPVIPPKAVRVPALKGCKYCLTLKKIQHDFALKAKAAQDLQDSALKASRSVTADKDAAKHAATTSRAELAAATDSFERFAAAAKALEPYLAACEQEAFCRPDYLAAASQKACRETAEDAGLRAPAIGMANVAREAAVACIAQACPSVDCGAVGELRQNLVEAAGAMSALGEPVAVSKGQPRVRDLPVGAATLASEISRAIKDVQYAAQNYPSLIERPQNAAQHSGQKPVMAEELAARQTETLRSVADVMAQAAVVTPFSIDARREAAWRMKSLSLSVGEAGRLSSLELLNGAEGKAYRIALSQNWGAALVDLAALSALSDRVNAMAAAPSGCNGQTVAAAQAARDAAALLDICRARAGCPVGLTPGPQADLRSTDAARAALGEAIPRAQAAGDVLSASLGQSAGAAVGGNELALAAAVLNAGGVCQAGDQR